MTSPAKLDFYFFIGSTYSYLSVQRAGQLAAQHGVRLDWRPFSLRTLLHEQNNVPFVGKPFKLRYMWRDLERRAARHEVPFNGVPPYPIDKDELANRVAMLAAMEGWCPEFSGAAYRTWFLAKQDPGSEETLRTILVALGRDPDKCLAQADSAEVRNAYAANTTSARALGIFGSPTFACGAEIFWGDDRLEDALMWAKEAKAS
jgi:2-hydroxychromene-2-carboxylate isomerase